jgi:cytoskeletal protein CcmA (bactofilin family)
MLFRKRSRPAELPATAPGPLEIETSTAGGRTAIGRHTRIVGRLQGEGPVVVRGEVKGTIAIRGGLSVMDCGRVEADVQAYSVDLAGQARGRMSASVRVSLTGSGVFEGEMDTPILEVSPGSIVRGRARVAGLPTKERRSSH